jgi:hypothetical protein
MRVFLGLFDWVNYFGRGRLLNWRGLRFGFCHHLLLGGRWLLIRLDTLDNNVYWLVVLLLNHRDGSVAIVLLFPYRFLLFNILEYVVRDRKSFWCDYAIAIYSHYCLGLKHIFNTFNYRFFHLLNKAALCNCLVWKQ